MLSKLLLVGSVPLETAEDVFTTFGPPLGPHLFSIPDGEVGDRRWWVLRMHFQVFNGHPDLITIKRPAPDNGVERLVPRDRRDMWQFKVKPGVDVVRFGNPGWRLGFARDAIASYFVFRKLRAEGVLPSHLRFQVSLPLVNSVITQGTFPEAGDIAGVREGYEAALAAEITTIVEKIPHRDLALQWDCSWEITDVNGGVPGLSPEGALARNVPQIARLSSIVPREVALGIHFCFGTFGGWPRFAPDSLGPTVELANEVLKSTDRQFEWINIPTLDRTDEGFYAPLKNLRHPSSTEIYLGAIHTMETIVQRLNVARKFLPQFGLAAYCGFGRLRAEDIPQIITDHVRAVSLLT
jgi:hypothetical protein